MKMKEEIKEIIESQLRVADSSKSRLLLSNVATMIYVELKNKGIFESDLTNAKLVEENEQLDRDLNIERYKSSAIQSELSAAKERVKELEKSKWISVKNPPTERMQEVLIFNGKAPHYCQCVLQAIWYLESEKFKIVTNTNITYNDITHWMPLPTNP